MQPAIRDIGTIVWTEKTEFVKQLSKEEYEIISFHGSTGNGKSMICAMKFMSRVMTSGRDEQNFVLAGRDIVALERRFVESNHSVFNWYPFKGRWEYRKIGVGGSRISIRARSGMKYIYLTPFNNVSTYSRILGDTIHGFMVDEAVESDELFLQEVVARITRTVGTFGLFTSNGGDPNHYFYTHILNRSVLVDEVCDVKWKTPIEEKSLDGEKKDNWLYVYMRLEDNPTYTEGQLKDFYTLYPVGSFMYNSRVLGVRGFSMDSPFAPYMNESVWVKENEISKLGLARLVFSVDSGGHVFSKKELGEFTDKYGMWYSEYIDGDYGTDEGGHTGVMTVGWNADYSEATIIDIYFPNHMHANINADRMIERAYKIGMEFPRVSRPYMFVDYADTTTLAMLRDKKGSMVREVRPAVKRDNSIGLDEPLVVSLIQQYAMRGKLKILDNVANRKYIYPAMVNARLESDGKLVDNRSWGSDVLDMLKYVFSSMYRLLVRR